MASTSAKTPTPSAPETAAPVTDTAAPVPPKKKNNKLLWLIIGLVVFFFVIVPGLLFTAGAIWLNNNASDKLAENAVEGIVEQATGGQVDIDSDRGSFSIENEQGDSSFSVGDNQSIPEDFPKSSIPFIDEKAVTFVFTSTDEGKKSWSVSTTVDESYESAKTFFEEKIVEPDYTDITTYGFGDSQTYYGIKSPYGVSITVSKSSDSPDVSVTYLISEQ